MKMRAARKAEIIPLKEELQEFMNVHFDLTIRCRALETYIANLVDVLANNHISVPAHPYN